MPEQSLHRTTQRVLDILELVARNNKGMSFSEISSAMSIPKGSLHPLLHTMQSRKFLRYSADNHRYYIGERLYLLGHQYIRDADLLNAIQAEVSSLSGEVGETSFFGVLRGGDVFYLCKGEASTPIRIVTSAIGNSNPAYSTGLGKALLLSHTYEQLCALYPERLPEKTVYSLKTREELWRQLGQMRERGLTYEKEESTLGIQCVAAPICCNDRIIAALSISIPVYRYSAERLPQMEKSLLHKKRQIEDIIQLNYDQWRRMYSED